MVVKGTGWYRVEEPVAFVARPDVAYRFVTEPGFFGRFALEQLRAQSARALR